MKHQNGFTLLELLIAIALLGMILLLLFGGLRLGLRSWDAAQSQLDTLNTVRSVELLLRQELERIHPYRWKEAPGQPLAFVGERDRISFVAPMPARLGGGGLHAIVVALESTGGNRSRLVWRQQPLTAKMRDFAELEQARAMVLAVFDQKDVQDLWLSYFGQENDTDPPQWFPRWSHATRLPLLIRVQARLAHDAHWPDFIVAPMRTSEFGR